VGIVVERSALAVDVSDEEKKNPPTPPPSKHTPQKNMPTAITPKPM
jgi:hypothetical protein